MPGHTRAISAMHAFNTAAFLTSAVWHVSWSVWKFSLMQRPNSAPPGGAPAQTCKLSHRHAAMIAEYRPRAGDVESNARTASTRQDLRNFDLPDSVTRMERLIASLASRRQPGLRPAPWKPANSIAFLATYRQQVALIIRVLPFMAEELTCALKGGTAINLFVPLRGHRPDLSAGGGSGRIARRHRHRHAA
jgi:hypothetical protein